MKKANIDSIHRGRLYDPEVMDACLRSFREKGYAIRD
jgi:hypothetical protein